MGSVNCEVLSDPHLVTKDLEKKGTGNNQCLKDDLVLAPSSRPHLACVEVNSAARGASQRECGDRWSVEHQASKGLGALR